MSNIHQSINARHFAQFKNKNFSLLQWQRSVAKASKEDFKSFKLRIDIILTGYGNRPLI